MEIEQFLPMLEDVHKVSDGYRARCPIHGGNKDVFHIWKDRGEIRVWCFTGTCDVREIKDRLGIAPRYNPAPTSASQPVESKPADQIADEMYQDLAESKTLADILSPKLTPDIIERLLKFKNPSGHEWIDDDVIQRLHAFGQNGMTSYHVVLNEFFNKAKYSQETRRQIKRLISRHATLQNGRIATHATPADQYARKPPIPQPYQHPQIMAKVGVTVLAGRPKMGKSYLALNLALAVSQGGMFASHFQVAFPGDVLYLALEDHESRMWSRLRALSGPDESLPSNLWFAYTAPTLDEGDLIEEIEEWLDLSAVTDPQLIVIDVFRLVQSHRQSRDDIYEFEYRDMTQLTRLAQERNLHILIVTHLNKSYSAVEDMADAIMSSTAITGGASGIWVMASRGEERCDAELHISGKDIPRWSCGLHQVKIDGHMDWRALGDVDTVIQGDVKIEILSTLHTWEGRAPNQTELRDSLGVKIDKGNFSKMLKKLRSDGLIRVERSRYHLTQAGASSAEIFNNLDNDDNTYNEYNSYNFSDNDIENQLLSDKPWEDEVDRDF